MKSLTERLPTTHQADGEELLEIYLEWALDLGIDLYPAQEEAALEIFDQRHVVLNTPTGSGKSLVAIAMHFNALAQGLRSFYTSPIKALVSEKFFSLCKTFGAENVGMLTGDAAINGNAPIVCCTAEVLANMALRQGEEAPVDAVIMDEFHYYSDRDRGWAWQLPLLRLTKASFLLMSATIGDTFDLRATLEKTTGRKCALVKSEERPVPLEFRYVQNSLIETMSRLVEQDRAPIYVVNFTQREASELAQSLTSTKFSSQDEKRAIRKALGGFRFDSPYGKKLRRYLEHGIGLHHAGLLPKYRLLVERLCQQGLLKVICGTDTLGVGVNVPIRSVLFTRLYKYDGESRRILSVRDFKQIAGRAGRKGFDDHGYVFCQAPPHVIENARLAAKAASQGRKKFTKKQPDKNFVHYDEATFNKLIESDSEQMKSSFGINHGMILNLIQSGDAHLDEDGGLLELNALIDDTHEHAGSKSALRKEGKVLFDALLNAGLVEETGQSDEFGALVELSEELHEDFSVFHTLGLYLLEVLTILDLDAPDFHLQVLSLVESILENPGPVLFAQEKREKLNKLTELKAAGMDYEERQEILEKITWPKPMANMIYDTFNTFSEEHPWVGFENIRPKSVVREMYERWTTFSEYVNELKLERSEGGLLRYLSQVYKTLLQTVPETYRSEEVEEVIAYLRTTLERVDSSLIQEWEEMLNPSGDADANTVIPGGSREIDISRNVSAFYARLRAESHALLKAVSEQDWESATGCVSQADEAWSSERIAAAFAPYFGEHEALTFDHQARLSDRVRIEKLENYVWVLRQTLSDPNEDLDWYFRAEIDLRGDKAPKGALLRLLEVGR